MLFTNKNVSFCMEASVDRLGAPFLGNYYVQESLGTTIKVERRVLGGVLVVVLRELFTKSWWSGLYNTIKHKWHCVHDHFDCGFQHESAVDQHSGLTCTCMY